MRIGFGFKVGPFRVSQTLWRSGRRRRHTTRRVTATTRYYARPAYPARPPRPAPPDRPGTLSRLVGRFIPADTPPARRRNIEQAVLAVLIAGPILLMGAVGAVGNAIDPTPTSGTGGGDTGGHMSSLWSTLSSLAPAPTSAAPATDSASPTPPAHSHSSAPAAPTTHTPTTAAPTRAAPPAPAPTTQAPSGGGSYVHGVHPGAFCSPQGAYGYTVDGTLMRCTSKDGDRARWRSVG